MTDTVFTSRDFNREPGRIKRAAAIGSVIITERGQPALAVLPYADYQRLRRALFVVVDALSMPGLSDIELDIARPTRHPRAATFD
ncbi:MAG TPA: type II toxin-antitoxin system prevent-host-death family antitoxin [Sphingomonas sp.]